MKKILLSFLLFTLISSVFADFKVLVFHKTNGFRHSGAITEGIRMFRSLGESNGWTTDDTQDASKFNTANLAQYQVVIWLNTSGGNLLNNSQKDAMKAFIQSGKGFIGLHAATDTYRGTNAGSTWDWYNDLVGAIVQTSPNHTPNNTNATTDILTDHPITDHLGSTWTRKEEWYYWQRNGGWLSPTNNVLIEVRSTGGNTYDEKRPITWYKEFDGGRSFYTAMGHNGSSFKDETKFIEMMRKAVLWAASELDVVDNCPDDPNKTEPGTCGCGVVDSPNCGLPYDVEGFIEAESFSNKSEDIKIEGGGTNGNLGFIKNNSFVEYEINVLQAGSYELKINASVGNGNGGTVNFSAGGTPVGSFEATSTSSWANYQIFTTTLTFPSAGEQTLRLDFTTSNSFALNYDYLDFEFLTATAINKETDFALNVFPNPAQEVLSIERSSDYVVNGTITVLDINMKEVLSLENESINKLDVSSLEAGVYHIRINSGGEVNYGMFVKE